MKVFISWSGDKSHQVAVAFRDWLPCVIQSLEPYVSSEDIDKGARWSSDIAKELADSTFGLLCVTKENLEAPWLSFEAGALSKTMDKSYVTPFLFDLKRSEVKGPILQFQSTIFDKEDIKKLVLTLKKASGDSKLVDSRIERSFDALYPTLEKELNLIKSHSEEPEETKKKDHKSEIIEEILEISRNNQILLRNPDPNISLNISELKQMLQEQSQRIEKVSASEPRRPSRSLNPMFIDEIIQHRSLFSERCGFLVVLSLFQPDFPWIYNMGKEAYDLVKSNPDKKAKQAAISEFEDILDFTFEHPAFREYFMFNKSRMYLRDYSFFLKNYLKQL